MAVAARRNDDAIRQQVQRVVAESVFRRWPRSDGPGEVADGPAAAVPMAGAEDHRLS